MCRAREEVGTLTGAHSGQRDAQLTTGSHRVSGVGGQIHEDLLEPGGVAPNQMGPVVVVHGDRDLVGQRAPHHGEKLGEERRQVDIAPFDGAAVSEVENLPDQRGRPLHLLTDGAEMIAASVIETLAGVQQLGVEADGAHDVVEVVCDPGGQLSDCGQAFLLVGPQLGRFVATAGGGGADHVSDRLDEVDVLERELAGLRTVGGEHAVGLAQHRDDDADAARQPASSELWSHETRLAAQVRDHNRLADAECVAGLGLTEHPRHGGRTADRRFNREIVGARAAPGPPRTRGPGRW